MNPKPFVPLWLQVTNHIGSKILVIAIYNGKDFFLLNNNKQDVLSIRERDYTVNEWKYYEQEQVQNC